MRGGPRELESPSLEAPRAPRPAPRGLSLERASASRLWATADELAKVVGTLAPDEIYLVPEANAAVKRLQADGP